MNYIFREMRKILVPVFNNRISSRLDCTKCFQLFNIENDIIKNVDQMRILSKNQFDKINSIISLKPDVIICNGLTSFYENEFRKNKINVIPWIHGKIDEVIIDFINNKLKDTGEESRLFE